MSRPVAETLREGLTTGSPEALAWLRARVRTVAAPRFSAWAWDRIEDDFLSDLVTQLLVTLRKPGFEFTGRPEAYVDRAIHNLCTTYFRHLARVRAALPLDADTPITEERALNLEELAVGLDLRRALLDLEAGCRALVLEKYVLGRSLAEMAKSRGIEAKTARSRLHTCREALRTIWFRLQHPRHSRLYETKGKTRGGTS